MVALADRVGQPVDPLGVVADGMPDEPLVGLANEKPRAEACADSLLLSRSAVWLRRVSSSGENQVPALQSSPMKMRG